MQWCVTEISFDFSQFISRTFPTSAATLERSQQSDIPLSESQYVVFLQGQAKPQGGPRMMRRPKTTDRQWVVETKSIPCSTSRTTAHSIFALISFPLPPSLLRDLPVLLLFRHVLNIRLLIRGSCTYVLKVT